jgi:hypothetical protein
MAKKECTLHNELGLPPSSITSKDQDGIYLLIKLRMDKEDRDLSKYTECIEVCQEGLIIERVSSIPSTP